MDLKMMGIQSIAVVAYICMIFMFQAKDKTQMLVWQFAMCLMFFVHYILLGPAAYVGAFINLAAMLRAFVFANRDSWAKSKIWLLAFVLIFSITAIGTWQGHQDFFTVIGIIASTFALWIKDINKSRELFIVSSFAWLTFNVLVGSYAGMVGEVCGLVSNMIAMRKYGRKVLTKDKNSVI